MSVLYFSALSIPEPHCSRIDALKHLIHDRFNCRKALNAPTHITVCPPRFMDDEDYRNFADIHAVIAGHWPTAKVRIKGTGHFGTRVIYLEPELPDDFYKAYRDASKLFEDEGNGGRTWHPHITLATRDIPPERFSEIMQFCCNYPVDAQVFEINTLCILRHDGRQWQEAAHYPLAGRRD